MSSTYREAFNLKKHSQEVQSFRGDNLKAIRKENCAMEEAVSVVPAWIHPSEHVTQ